MTCTDIWVKKKPNNKKKNCAIISWFFFEDFNAIDGYIIAKWIYLFLKWKNNL